MVTGWFGHGKARAQDLWVEGSGKGLGVTPKHRLSSLDGNDGVPAGDHCVGESLRGRDDDARMLPLEWHDTELPV